MIKSVLDYLEKSEKQYPDKIAVTDTSGSETYASLTTKARQVGTYLSQKGLQSNDVVMILLDKGCLALSAFWGVTYAGGIYAPIDCHAPLSRLKTISKVLRPAYILTDNANYSKAKQLVSDGSVLLMNDTLNIVVNFSLLEKIQRQRIDTDPLYIICTSGSTGIPKGVVISHRAVIDFTEEASTVMSFTANEVFANQAPFYFDASVPDLYCTIRNGATLHIIPEKWFSFPIQVLEYIKDHNINAIFWVPTALIITANLKALEEVDVTCLKKIMFCGEVMPVKQYNIWKKHVPAAKYVNYYGPSETTYASTYYVINREFNDDETLPIGRAAINTGVLILNEEDRQCVCGEIGELCIRGSGVSLGYYNDPEKTNEAFVQNPLSPYYRDIIYRTGDLVYENDLGEIEYVGRKDFQIKHLGYRIELGEIENAVMSIQEVRRACCIYHEQHQTIILLYEGNIDKDHIKYEMKNRLPEYMVPGEIIKLEAMPLNSNGKIDRKLLSKKYTSDG